TVLGLGVSLLAAGAFVTGRTRCAGGLLILAGLCDFFDGSLARASGQVSAFGAFLDSVIDRYSDLVVLLSIVVLFAQMPHARGAVVAMAGLIGSMMVSYTKARAESIGISCTVGIMERPERMICLIAGALLDLLEPALWVLAILSNLTAIQRIAFTWRATRDTAIFRALIFALPLVAAVAIAGEAPPPAAPEGERAWPQAVEAYQQGDVGPLLREFGADAAQESVIGDHVRYLLADALEREGDIARARATALSVAERLVDEVRVGPVATRALRVITDAARRLNRQELTTRTLGLLIDRSPTERRPALRLELARLHVRASERNRALAALETVVTSGTEAEKAEALFLKGRVLEDLSREGDAIAVYRSVVANHPTREAAAASLWRLGWLAYGKRNAQGALRSWTRLAELGSAGAYRLPALYWAARAREQLGGAGAPELYERILTEAPRSYYGL